MNVKLKHALLVAIVAASIVAGFSWNQDDAFPGVAASEADLGTVFGQAPAPLTGPCTLRAVFCSFSYTCQVDAAQTCATGEAGKECSRSGAIPIGGAVPGVPGSQGSPILGWKGSYCQSQNANACSSSAWICTLVTNTCQGKFAAGVRNCVCDAVIPAKPTGTVVSCEVGGPSQNAIVAP